MDTSFVHYVFSASAHAQKSFASGVIETVSARMEKLNSGLYWKALGGTVHLQASSLRSISDLFAVVHKDPNISWSHVMGWGTVQAENITYGTYTARSRKLHMTVCRGHNPQQFMFRSRAVMAAEKNAKWLLEQITTTEGAIRHLESPPW